MSVGDLILEYRGLTSLKEGAIADALKRFYSAYPIESETQRNEWLKSWEDYDREIFENPETVGRAGFASFLKGDFVGFVSWDPRGAPDAVIVGHNGILPEYHGRGFGAVQLRKMIEIFIEKGYKTALVTTGANDFFAPARRMYLSLGFRETERVLQNGFAVVRYEMTL